MTRKREGRPGQRVPIAMEGPAPRERATAPAEERGRRAFVEPELVRHEKLTRLTLVSDFGGGGGGGGSFFG